MAGQNTGEHGGVQTDCSNLAPRLGFAYSLTSKTVVRGGFDLTSAPVTSTSGSALVNQPFVAIFGTYTPAQAAAAARLLGVPNPVQHIKFAGGLPTPNPNSYTHPSGSITAALDPISVDLH